MRARDTVWKNILDNSKVGRNLFMIVLLILPVYIFIDYVLAKKMDEAASMKGHDSVFVLCFLLGPAAYLYVIALPDLKLREAIKAMAANGSVPMSGNGNLQASGSTGSSIFSRSAEAPVLKSSGGKWTCPECGESNSTSTRICRGCGREK